jgi:Flp pilus assembly protein TadD
MKQIVGCAALFVISLLTNMAAGRDARDDMWRAITSSLEKGDYDAAAKALTEAIRADPANAKLYYDRGLV